MTEILMKFNNYLMELSATNENIEISEHWLNCMADLSNIQNGDVTKINNTLVRFDRYISVSYTHLCELMSNETPLNYDEKTSLYHKVMKRCNDEILKERCGYGKTNI